MYVNPTPLIDAGKDFTIQLDIHLDDITEVEHAKEIIADYILSLSKEELKKALRCKEIKPVYPDEIMKNNTSTKMKQSKDHWA